MCCGGFLYGILVFKIKQISFMAWQMSVLYLESVWRSPINFSKKLLKGAQWCCGYDDICHHQCQTNEVLFHEVLSQGHFFYHTCN